MTGVLVLVLLWLLIVMANRRADRGHRERLALEDLAYGGLLGVMGAFDAAGGRVQEVDSSTAMIRKGFRLTVLTPFLVAAFLVGTQLLFGYPRWIVVMAVAAWILVNGTMTWAVSGLFGVKNAEGEKGPLEGLLVTAATVVKAALVATGLLVAWRGVTDVNDSHWLEGVGRMLVAYLLVTYCYLPVAWVERLARRGAEVRFADRTPSDAILLLRSFADDDFRLYTPVASFGARYRFVPGRKRFEEFLAATLTSSGRLVGVGKPGERTPTLGAARSYWAHDDWKEAIRATAGRTKALMVMAGRTPSLAWEMGQLQELRVTGKALVLFPPDGPDGTAERHRFITDALDIRPEWRLPEELLVTLTAMSFEPTGQPIYYTSCGRDWSSYVATVLHFMGTLGDRFVHERAGNMAGVLDLVEDPFNQAAFLLTQRHGRDLAKELVDEAGRADASSSTRVGQAWARLAIDDDPAGARVLLTDGLADDPGDGLLTRALAALDAVEAGTEDPQVLLHARYPEGMRNRDDGLVSGTARMGLRTRVAFAKAKVAAQDGWDGWTPQEILAAATKARRLAETEGLTTGVAQADVWAAVALVKLGRPDEARTLYQEVSALSSAPRTEIARGLKWLDPRDIVDEALTGLLDVMVEAEAEEDVIAAAERLWEYRVEQGFREQAGKTAGWLTERYLRRGLDADAIRWGDLAYRELDGLGHKLGAARVAANLAQAHNNLERWEGAMTWAAKAQADAEVIGNEDVAQWARFEAARADQAVGDPQAAWRAFEAIFQREIGGNRWRARASLIRLGQIDARRVRALALQAAEADLAFYGPQAAVRLAEAARAEPDDHEAAAIWVDAVGVATRALASAGISSDDAERAWPVVVEGAARAPEPLRSQLVAAVSEQASSMSMLALGRAENHLHELGSAQHFDELAALAGPISSRYESLLSAVPEPSVEQVNALVGLLWELARGLRYTHRLAEAATVSQQMVAHARHLPDLEGGAFPLARCLAKCGHDLAHSDRPREAVDAMNEAIDLFEATLARGTDCWSDLVAALTARGDYARDLGDTPMMHADLARAQALIDEHRAADWAGRAQEWLDRVVEGDGGTGA